LENATIKFVRFDLCLASLRCLWNDDCSFELSGREWHRGYCFFNPGAPSPKALRRRPEAAEMQQGSHLHLRHKLAI